jgi:hypothetical protein
LSLSDIHRDVFISFAKSQISEKELVGTCDVLETAQAIDIKEIELQETSIAYSTQRRVFQR